MQIPRDIVDAIRDRTDIVPVVERHVRLERRGNSYVGLCPFHQEKSPSFNVVPQKQMYYCFGCRKGGDVFRFLMEVEGLSFAEAVRELAQGAGVVIPERELSEADRRRLRERATLFEVLEAACGFYESVLWTRPEGAPGRDYLARRGMDEATIRAARLGYAPPGWQTTSDTLRRQGFPEALIARAGLTRANQSGRAYDLLRERVVFPIRDDRSRVIAFGGRILEGDGPKYLNTPETELYEKSKTLYGIETARPAIGSTGRAIVVEGYFDVLSMQQAGFKETVATCGTALTADHLERLRKLAKDLYVVLDADAAGSRAADGIVRAAVDTGLATWRVQVPGAKDPDELVRTEGPDAMKAALDAREPLVDWVIDWRIDQRGDGAQTRQQIVDELVPVLAGLPETVISRAASRMRVPEDVLLGKIAAFKRKPRPAEPAPDAGEPAVPTWTPRKEVVHLVWLLVHRRDRVGDLVDKLRPEWIDPHPALRRAMGRLIVGEPVAAVQASTEDPMVANLLARVATRAELYADETSRVAFAEIVETMLSARRQAQMDHLANTLEKLARTDPAAVADAVRQRTRLGKQTKDARSALNQSDVAAWAKLLDTEPLATVDRGTGS